MIFIIFCLARFSLKTGPKHPTLSSNIKYAKIKKLDNLLEHGPATKRMETLIQFALYIMIVQYAKQNLQSSKEVKSLPL